MKVMTNKKMIATSISLILAVAFAAVFFFGLEQKAAADVKGCVMENTEKQSASNDVSRKVIYLGDYVVDGKIYFEGFFDLNGDGFGQDVLIDGAEVTDDEDLYLEITDCAFDPKACSEADDAFYYQHGFPKEHISISYRTKDDAALTGRLSL